MFARDRSPCELGGLGLMEGRVLTPAGPQDFERNWGGKGSLPGRACGGCRGCVCSGWFSRATPQHPLSLLLTSGSLCSHGPTCHQGNPGLPWGGPVLPPSYYPAIHPGPARLSIMVCNLGPCQPILCLHGTALPPPSCWFGSVTSSFPICHRGHSLRCSGCRTAGLWEGLWPFPCLCLVPTRPRPREPWPPWEARV